MGISGQLDIENYAWKVGIKDFFFHFLCVIFSSSIPPDLNFLIPSDQNVLYLFVSNLYNEILGQFGIENYA